MSQAAKEWKAFHAFTTQTKTVFGDGAGVSAAIHSVKGSRKRQRESTGRAEAEKEFPDCEADESEIRTWKVVAGARSGGHASAPRRKIRVAVTERGAR